MFRLDGKYTSATIYIDDVEKTCIKQITQFINHPAFTNHIAIMPDTHAGKGAVIGFTMPMTNKVIPNVIGYDIGCSILFVEIKPIEPTYEMEQIIRDVVPIGFDVCDTRQGDWENFLSFVNTKLQNFIYGYNIKFQTNYKVTETINEKWFESKCKKIHLDVNRAYNSVGTLGGGNHFIEIGKSESSRMGLSIHSGSRKFGQCICQYWQKVATERMNDLKKEFQQNVIKQIRENFKGSDIQREINKHKALHSLDIKASDLDYLEGYDAFGYLCDMVVAQAYAKFNRKVICRNIVRALELYPIDLVETVHNYINFDDLIIRKGAVSSYKGSKLVIPFTSKDGVTLCEGKSNPTWNYSAPHGAGRKFSRSKAKLKVSLDKYKSDMDGIITTSVSQSTLDEAPDAYKDPTVIKELIKDTVDILETFKPVLVVKDKEVDK